ncbi:hypothetical protein [Chamaesiphon sp. VAR_69_metabat_338]|uniref:hypothetical protein n=1 Tax=Chamaesiphon sp. VAR_69_metabat_338 TaxID=2964704 RepID=UPI00286D99C4|nr:hypothetical protein [Chamaesiphon sp. VAR_69_metabat_338]
MITQSQSMVQHGIGSSSHACPPFEICDLSILSDRQSSPRSAFIPTLTEAVERGTSRLPVKNESSIVSRSL